VIFWSICKNPKEIDRIFKNPAKIIPMYLADRSKSAFLPKESYLQDFLPAARQSA
jgi:hypothetical protein